MQKEGGDIIKSMSRHIQHFYPQFLFDRKQKRLFNPILKKRYKNLPEERVRLQWVDYILQNKLWSKGRIGFETPVKNSHLETVFRADLVLYNKNMKPEILIECKAESVALTESAAKQAARYNRSLGAKYIVLTNGRSYQIFKFDTDGQPVSSDLPFENPSISPRSIDYWQKRGFCSSTLKPEPESWLTDQFQVFSPGYSGAAATRYLNFSGDFIQLPMDHYYRIIPLNNREKMAYTFLGFPETETFALFVLNEKGKNRGLAVLNITKLFSGDTPQIQIISSGVETLKSITLSDINTLKGTDPLLLPEFIRKFFD